MPGVRGARPRTEITETDTEALTMGTSTCNKNATENKRQVCHQAACGGRVRVMAKACMVAHDRLTPPRATMPALPAFRLCLATRPDTGLHHPHPPHPTAGPATPDGI